MVAEFVCFSQDMRLGACNGAYRRFYSCDHFVYAENKLGNIMESDLERMVDSQQQEKFGLDKLTSLPGMCRECDVRFACNGECPKHRFVKTPDGEPGLDYLSTVTSTSSPH